MVGLCNLLERPSVACSPPRINSFDSRDVSCADSRQTRQIWPFATKRTFPAWTFAGIGAVLPGAQTDEGSRKRDGGGAGEGLQTNTKLPFDARPSHTLTHTNPAQRYVVRRATHRPPALGGDAPTPMQNDANPLPSPLRRASGLPGAHGNRGLPLSHSVLVLGS